jgi:hypothetical protein
MIHDTTHKNRVINSCVISMLSVAVLALWWDTGAGYLLVALVAFIVLVVLFRLRCQEGSGRPGR